jgi:hypothetical protein
MNEEFQSIWHCRLKMSYHIIFSPEAEEQLAALYNYIADAASPDCSRSQSAGLVQKTLIERRCSQAVRVFFARLWLWLHPER